MQRVEHGVEWDIVIVTHNSARDLREMWCGRAFPSTVRIIVVDNGSTDDSAAVAAEFANIVVTSPNVGLAKSNNVGARLGSGPYVAFCNPDVFITDEDLSYLKETIDRRDGLVAPRLVGDDGEAQPNGRAFPSPIRQFCRHFLPNSRLANRYLWPSTEGGEVDWVTGALIGIKRAHFDTIGGWPEGIFLYFEDVEICARARDAGIGVYIDEELKVRHSWGQASRSLTSNAAKNHLSSAVKYYRNRPEHILLV